MNNEFLKTILDTPLPTISEELFKSKYIYALWEYANNKDIKANLRWVKEIAGTGRCRVNVIDPKGNVLFTVPPIESTVTESRPRLKLSLNEVITQSRRYMLSRQEKTAEKLTSSIYSHFTLPDDPTERETWLSIFRHYGFYKGEAKPLFGDATTVIAVSNTPDVNTVSNDAFSGDDDDF